MGDGFYRSKDPTNSIKVLKENATRKSKERREQKTYAQTIIETKKILHKINTASTLVYNNMG